jgi:hypothetical protein
MGADVVFCNVHGTALRCPCVGLHGEVRWYGLATALVMVATGGCDGVCQPLQKHAWQQHAQVQSVWHLLQHV